MAKLCPGKSQFNAKAKNLDPAIFRRLVARRGRRYLRGKDIPLTAKEKDRQEVEKLIFEKVSETADFLPSRYLVDGSNRSAAVCRIVVPLSRGRSFGTGFLISQNLIMTNNHVLRTSKVANNATAEFAFEDDQTAIVLAIRPDILFITDRTLDFTIVGVEGRGIEDLSPIGLRRDPTLITRHERANIIQHPNARRKEITIHDNPVVRVLDTVIRYQTDTEPGSSGSPVFNDDWDLVGLHHAGVVNRDGTATNEGIRISAIVDHLISQFQREESAGSNDAIRQLLSSVTDTSPLVGFFDTHGLGKSELEIQVDHFQGTPEFADVGVWNIEHFNRNVSHQRIVDVANVIGRLGLDVFGLTEVQKGALDRLVTEMAGQGWRYDYVLRDTSGSQDIAILYDTDTAEVVRMPEIATRNQSILRKRTNSGKTAFPRWPLFARCRVDQVEWIMIVVHLKAFGDAQSRARRRLAAKCLAEIIDDIQANEGLPVVLGGDFNERLDNDVLAAITDAPDLLSMTADDATDGAISYVGRRHRSLIDHIMVSKDIRLGQIGGDDTAIVRLDRSVSDFASSVSDHVPLVFRMILRDNPIDIADDNDNDDAYAIPIPDEVASVIVQFE